MTVDIGRCPDCGRINAVLNVGRRHYGYCEEHAVYWYIGENLFSSWQKESRETWRKNRELLWTFKKITLPGWRPEILDEIAAVYRNGQIVDLPVEQLTVKEVRELLDDIQRMEHAGVFPDHWPKGQPDLNEHLENLFSLARQKAANEEPFYIDGRTGL